MTLAEIMTQPPVTVRDDDTVEEVAARMIAHRVGCLPVVTQQGRIVARHDLLRLTLHLLSHWGRGLRRDRAAGATTASAQSAATPPRMTRNAPERTPPRSRARGGP